MSENKLSGLKKHNEETNATVRESLAEALLILMKKLPYDKISVTALCEKAGVSRMAFYGNFESKDEILKGIIVRLNVEIVVKIGSPFRKNTDLKWYERLFTITGENQQIMQLIFSAGFQNFYREIVNDIVLHDKGISVKERYARIVWVGGVLHAVAYWFETGMRESAEEIASFVYENIKAYAQ